jgi:uncharacterized membrane protein (UPF0127 family)
MVPPSMRAKMSALVALFLFLLVPIASLAAGFGSESLSIRRQDGTELHFQVELAVTPGQRQQGLMQRKDMAADRGMLFDFGASRQVHMWMKNTYLPLDMLFIRTDGTIATIRSDTVPLSEEVIDSKEPVRFVLELNAGTSKKLGIRAGDRAHSATIAAASASP